MTSRSSPRSARRAPTGRARVEGCSFFAVAPLGGVEEPAAVTACGSSATCTSRCRCGGTPERMRSQSPPRSPIEPCPFCSTCPNCLTRDYTFRCAKSGALRPDLSKGAFSVMSVYTRKGVQLNEHLPSAGSCALPVHPPIQRAGRAASTERDRGDLAPHLRTARRLDLLAGPLRRGPVLRAERGADHHAAAASTGPSRTDLADRLLHPQGGKDLPAVLPGAGHVRRAGAGHQSRYCRGPVLPREAARVPHLHLELVRGSGCRRLRDLLLRLVARDG